jgi:Protein of unknown function (DUF2889)
MNGPKPVTVTRAKTMEVTPVGEDRYRFTARLTDSSENGNYPGGAATIHDFGLEGEAEGPDLTLVSLDVHAYAHPYADCPFVIPATQRLIGQPLLSGWRRAVIAQGAGPAGCTHVNTLLIGLGELSTMVYFVKINASVPYARETLTDGRWTQGALDVSPGLAGVCHGLRADGRAVTAARDQAAKHTSAPD